MHALEQLCQWLGKTTASTAISRGPLPTHEATVVIAVATDKT
jgi:hypothetical protein